MSYINYFAFLKLLLFYLIQIQPGNKGTLPIQCFLICTRKRFPKSKYHAMNEGNIAVQIKKNSHYYIFCSNMFKHLPKRNSHNIWIGGGVEDKKKKLLGKGFLCRKMYKQIATSCTLLPLQNKFNLLKIKKY